MVNPPLVSSRDLFSVKKWRVREEAAPLPDGTLKTMVRVYHTDRVHILALPTDASILVLREYRPMYGEYVWMLPTGNIDKESDPREAALRELREETGFSAEQCMPFGTSRHAESIVITCHYFVAKRLQFDPLPKDETEKMECHPLPLDEAAERILNSPVVHTPSAFAILKFLREHRR